MDEGSEAHVTSCQIQQDYHRYHLFIHSQVSLSAARCVCSEQ